MRLFALAAAAAAVAALTGPTAVQAQKGAVVELAGMKSAAPADWKEEPQKPGSMRMHTFKAPKAEGDSEDAELAIFFFQGNAGIVSLTAAFPSAQPMK